MVADAPLRLEYIDPADLAANELNWRRHPPEQVAGLRDAVERVGWAGALLYNERTQRLIDGHARKELFEGRGPVPVLVGSWSEAQEKFILATLDPLGAMAEADADKLEALLGELAAGGDELTPLLEQLAQDNDITLEDIDAGPPEDQGPAFDRAAELQARWQTVRGQLWVIPSVTVPGRCHKLLCGDSTDTDDVARVMGGEQATLCFTSPPYAEQREYGGGLPPWDMLMQGVFTHLPMADDGQVLVNLGLVHRDGEWLPYWLNWLEWMREQGWRRFGWYVWDQGHGLPGSWNGRLAPSHEFVFHFNRAPRRPNKIIPKKPESITLCRGTTMRRKDGSCPAKSSPEAGLQPTKIPDSVIRINRHYGRGVEVTHPAVFPVRLPAFVQETFSAPGDVCYEPFAGSGSQHVAAEQTGRLCCGLELSPAYCAVALQRLADIGLEPRCAG